MNMKALKLYWQNRNKEARGTLWFLTFMTIMSAIQSTFEKPESVGLLWCGVTIGILGHAAVMVVANYQKDK